MLARRLVNVLDEVIGVLAAMIKAPSANAIILSDGDAEGEPEQLKSVWAGRERVS